MAAAAAVTALASCALMPFTPDRTARAPVYEGFGQLDIAITTQLPGARDLFNRGVLQAYAFNEVEAVRVFKAALALDPECAMCAWGVAWQLGPNINATDRGDLSEALRYVDYALNHTNDATPRERALIESLAVRYAHSSQARETAPLMAEVCGKSGEDDDEKVHPLDAAYAQRLRLLVDRYPDDPDILSLYAEAEMIATAGDWWSKDGKPGGRIGEVADRIERLRPRYPDHTGLTHYMIHVADALPVAQRAVAAADHLGALAPRSPHLVHMPSHIYVHVGRYGDATRVNQAAVADDVTLAELQTAQGFSVSKDWRGHDLDFLWFASLMEGRGDVALDAARERALRAAKADSNYGEYVRSKPLMTLVRLERWEDVLKEPQPSGNKGLAQVYFEQSHGIAQARLGQTGAAQESLARLQAAVAATRKNHATSSWMDKTVRSLLDVAEGTLIAEVAGAQKHFDEAIAQQLKVVDAAAKLDAREPPLLAGGTRLALGDLQASAGRWADAEKTYRQDLEERPGSGWAMRGLVRALDAQGRRAEAAAMREALRRGWSQASPALRLVAG
jgi:tetratricopeptide (TPR) repeat protein